jgi:hypothetical protein
MGTARTWESERWGQKNAFPCPSIPLPLYPIVAFRCMQFGIVKPVGKGIAVMPIQTQLPAE